VICLIILACMFAFSWSGLRVCVCRQAVCLWLQGWWKTEEIVVRSEMSKWRDDVK
jgi:hypothetical protein